MFIRFSRLQTSMHLAGEAQASRISSVRLWQLIRCNKSILCNVHTIVFFFQIRRKPHDVFLVFDNKVSFAFLREESVLCAFFSPRDDDCPRLTI